MVVVCGGFKTIQAISPHPSLPPPPFQHPDLIEKRRALFGDKLRGMLPAGGGSAGVGGGASGASTPSGQAGAARSMSGMLRLRR